MLSSFNLYPGVDIKETSIVAYVKLVLEHISENAI